jgi:hypothetical protein
MTKIANKIAYRIKTLINPNDYVPGTDSETSNLETVNFLFKDIAAFAIAGLSPEVGGTIKITEIIPVTEETNPVVVANALVPDYEVGQYELLFLNLNGVIHLLKLVNRSIGAESTALPAGSFISFPVSVGPQGLAGTNGEDGTDGEDGEDGTDGRGITSIALTSTAGLVKTYTITFTDATTFNFNVADGDIAELENPQKTINTFPYTLVNGDDKHTIFVENGVSNVVINVPNGLVDNFTCSFLQKGTGEITIQQSGTASLLFPSTTLENKIKGQYYWAMVEKELATNNYYLIGSLKPL